MFVAQALYPFSSIVLQQNTQQQKQQQKQQKQHQLNQNQKQSLRQEKQNKQKKQEQSNQLEEQGQVNKRGRSASQQKQLFQMTNRQQNNQKAHYEQQIQAKTLKQQNQKQQNQSVESIKYLTFQTGEKILVKQAYENGWWYGNTIKNPSFYGFFPSNYVKVGSKPPPPPKQQNQSYQQSQERLHTPNQDDGAIDWVSNQLKKVQKGPIQSVYYLGIKGYKNVKIDDKNQNILKGDHVKFDVNTGLAKVPIKDQAPTAKAVRQMGYYFDYHQWCEERNKAPDSRARPDASRKKKKKLNLKFMN